MGYGPNGMNVLLPSDPTTLAECWIQPTSTPNLVKLTANPTMGAYVPMFIMAACAGINKMCNRKFNKQAMHQIFQNEILWVRDYKSYALQNGPIITVDHVYLQIVATWAEIVSTYWQVMPNERIVKILPTFNPYALVTLPSYYFPVTTNLWVEFTSGYAVDYSTGMAVNDVPMPVQMATAMYVDYLFSRFNNLQGGASQYSTQTFSTTFAIGDNDPVYASIKTLLQPYIYTNYV
jgi:hypothetical protein